MNKIRHGFAMRPTAAAVRAVLMGFALVPAGAAYAQAAGGDATVAELTTPTKSVEVGVGDVSRDAIKANEYNGLQRQGAYGIVDFDLRGGGAYDSSDPTRWRLLGTDLGLETRDIQMEYGEQGKFRLNAGFDELLRSGSAVYQTISTPYQGVGTTSLTLPSNWSAPLYQSGTTMGAPNNFPAPSQTMLGSGGHRLRQPARDRDELHLSHDHQRLCTQCRLWRRLHDRFSGDGGKYRHAGAEPDRCERFSERAPVDPSGQADLQRLV